MSVERTTTTRPTSDLTKALKVIGQRSSPSVAHEIVGEPWIKQRGETFKAFRAWQLYRDAPAEKRSLQYVAQAFYGPRAASNIRQIARWSRAWNWQMRLQAWTLHTDSLARSRSESASAETLQRLKSAGESAVFIVDRELKRIAEDENPKLSAREIVAISEAALKLYQAVAGVPAGDGEVEKLLAAVADGPEQESD